MSVDFLIASFAVGFGVGYSWASVRGLKKYRAFAVRVARLEREAASIRAYLDKQQ